MNRLSASISIFMLGILLFSVNSFAQQDLKFGNSKFQDKWDKVDKFEKTDLPKSALAMVEEIFALAKKENNPGQQAKALIYMVKYRQDIEEKGLQNSIHFIENELKTAQFPVNRIFQSVLAEAYEGYYRQEKYSIDQRSTLSEGSENDTDSWDAITFAKKIVNLYQQSCLNAEKSGNIPVSLIDDIIETGTMDRKIRPSLYEFLMYRAIDFYNSNNFDLPRPVEEFTLNGEKLLVSMNDFLKIDISTNDTLSFKYLALKSYSALLNFHLADPVKEALGYADFDRIEYILGNSDFGGEKKRYFEILTVIKEKSDLASIKAEALYKIALLIHDGYRPEYSDEKISLNKIAKEICDEVISEYPGTSAADKCMVVKSGILAKSINIKTEAVIPSDKPDKFLIEYKNHSEIYVKIVRVDDGSREKLNQMYEDEKIYSLLNSMKVVYTNDYKLPLPDDFMQHSAELPLPALTYGSYALMVSTDKNFKKKNNYLVYSYFQVSDLRLITEDDGNGIKQHFRLLNATTGKPEAGARIELWKHDYDKPKSKIVEMMTDSNGFCENIKADVGYFSGEVVVTKGKDVFYWNNSWFSYRTSQVPSDHFYTWFFTDRSIYRPGQTIYFKGIVVKSNNAGSLNQPEKNYKSTVALFDPNVQKLSEVEVQTNEYGSFSESFVIPVSVLTGNFLLNETYGALYFKVEEYKRPKFEVIIDPPQNTYKLNQEVKIGGMVKSYSAIPLSGAKIKYRVVRNAEWPYWDRWWSPRPSIPEKEILNGFMKSDSAGKYNLNFTALADPDIPVSQKPLFNYTIYIDVTDLNGETQTASCTVKAGTVAVAASIEIGDCVLLNKKIEYSVKTLNLNGNPVKLSGRLVINKIAQPEKLLREKLWDSPDQFVIEKAEYEKNFPFDLMTSKAEMIAQLPKTQVYSANINGNSTISIPDEISRKLEQGNYEFVFEAKDTFGNDVIVRKNTVMIDPGSKENALNEFSYLVTVNSSVQPGENAQFVWGSAYDAMAFVQIERGGIIIDTKQIFVSKGQKLIEIPITEADRGNISFNLVTIIQNRPYFYNKLIQVPWNNKKLQLSLLTFRSNLEPGKKENWTLRVTGPEKEKVTAEILASMYDASLDKFEKQSWNFNVFREFRRDFDYRIPIIFTPSIASAISDDWYKYYYGKGWYYDRLKYQIVNYHYSMGLYELSKEMPRRYYYDPSPPPPNEDIRKMPVFSKNIMFDDVSDKVSEQASRPVQIRKNFSETAFFYPALKINKDGDYTISFTSPEALTRWKLMLLAHTTDLKSAYLEDFAVTSKKLMVTTNNPRFVRIGDELNYQVKLSNVSDSVINGKIELRLSDPYLMKSLDSLFGLKVNVLNFELKAGQSKNFEWLLHIPAGLDMAVFQVTATSKYFSDGEENVIPVLPDKMLVTETLPLWIREGQVKKFTFDKLLAVHSPTLENRSLTLELSSNPAWYAVLSLPYLLEYPNECSEQTFNRYYANIISKSLCNSDPRIQKVFESWKNTNALKSPLEKNQDLKSVLLNESPWVLQGKNETEQRERIAQLFDENQLNNSLTEAVMKLQQLQLPSGAWPWFKGMEASRFITQYVVTGFGHLRKMGIQPEPDVAVMTMIGNGVNYLDQEMLNDYNNLSKNKIRLDQENISYEQVQYLYARSFFTEIEIPAEAKAAFNYWKNQAEKYWAKKGLMTKAMTALALNRFGNIQLPVKIIASLKEYSTNNEEMGMFWKGNVSSWYWYEAPVETQSLIIEAFSEISNDSISLDNMRIWLLKQKQVQSWSTTKSTADACYALLKTGKSWLDSGSGLNVFLDEKKIDLQVPGAEAGTGYVKTRWTGNEIYPSLGNVRMEKKDKGIAWGAMYWQYFEKLDKITPSTTPLKIEKEIYLVENTAQGPVLKKITENQPLKAGDMLKVRLIVKSDREMEFIHLKDMRAAALEPTETLSGYEYQAGLGYYKSIRDASVNYFFDHLPKGTFVLEYNLVVSQEGVFMNGISSIQSMYAPEFSSHTGGGIIKIGK